MQGFCTVSGVYSGKTRLLRKHGGLEGNKDEELVWAVDSVPAVHAAIDKLVDVHMSVQVFHTCTCVCIPVV